MLSYSITFYQFKNIHNYMLQLNNKKDNIIYQTLDKYTCNKEKTITNQTPITTTQKNHSVSSTNNFDNYLILTSA